MSPMKTRKLQIVTMQKDIWKICKLDPIMLQENYKSQALKLEKTRKNLRGLNKNGNRHNRRRKTIGKKMNTEDDVILRGGGCNVPPIPKMFCNYEYLIVLVSGKELQAKAPIETKLSSLYKLILPKQKTQESEDSDTI